MQLTKSAVSKSAKTLTASTSDTAQSRRLTVLRPPSARIWATLAFSLADSGSLRISSSRSSAAWACMAANSGLKASATCCGSEIPVDSEYAKGINGRSLSSDRLRTDHKVVNVVAVAARCEPVLCHMLASSSLTFAPAARPPPAASPHRVSAAALPFERRAHQIATKSAADAAVLHLDAAIGYRQPCSTSTKLQTLPPTCSALTPAPAFASGLHCARSTRRCSGRPCRSR